MTHITIHSLICPPACILQCVQVSHLSNRPTDICWSPLKVPGGCRGLPFGYVDTVGLAFLLMRIWLVHTHRHRLRLHRDRVPPECILHRHLGLGHILPVPVLPVGAALGALQPHLEHALLHGGHDAQEQEPVDHSQHQQLHLPCHRVLGVRPASLREGGGRLGGGREDSPRPHLLPSDAGVSILGWDRGEVGCRFGDKPMPLVSDRPGTESRFCHVTGCLTFSKSLPLSEPQFL